jgi:rhamnosyl/mannosyltransferase
MRILHIGKYYPPFHGGIENFMSDLMSEQNKQGHQVQAIVHHHMRQRTFDSDEYAEGVIHRVSTLGSLVFVPIAPSFGRYLTYVIDQFKPDIIHMHMPNVSCFWGLFSSDAKSIPWVIHWHSDVVGAAPDWRVKLLYPFYRVFEKALIKKAVRIITTSKPYKETSAPLECYNNKCDIVELGIRDRKLDVPVDSDKGLKLLCVGRLTYYKGHEVLLKALSILDNKGVSLSVVGQGELEMSLKSFISEFGIEKQVQFLGSLSDESLEQELLKCDILCLPSIERTEAFGMVLLEAMRASKPCLVTDVEGSGMSWVVQDGKTGFVVKAGDADVLASKLRDITNNKDALLKLGKNGRHRFESEFTIREVYSKIDAIYQQAIGK